MKMLNAPEGAWLYGSMFPTWSGYRKGATAQQIPARFDATDVPESGFGLVQHCIKLGSRALTLPRENDSALPPLGGARDHDLRKRRAADRETGGFTTVSPGANPTP
jgi:hypothetical protein